MGVRIPPLAVELLLKALEHLRGLELRQAKIEALAADPFGQDPYPAAVFKEVALQIHYVMAM